MKYVLLFAGAADGDWAEVPVERQEAVMAEINEWWERHAAAGTILGGERLQSSATATTFRWDANGDVVTTDGPFVEAKEEVGGFGVIDVPDLDAALALAKTWPALQLPGESVEVRPCWAE